MNGLNSDPGLRDALAKQHFERRFSESEKARLIEIASSEKVSSSETGGVNLGQIYRAVTGRIAQSTSSLLIALNLKNDSINA